MNLEETCLKTEAYIREFYATIPKNLKIINAHGTLLAQGPLRGLLQVQGNHCGSGCHIILTDDLKGSI